jgi:excisionase family DNA binding protein
MAKPIEQTLPFEVIAFRIPDAVKASGLSRSTIYELAAAGKLKLSRIGGRTLVPRAELERLIAAGQQAA